MGRKRRNHFIITALLVFAALILYQLAGYYEWFELIDKMPFHRQIENALLKKLTFSPEESSATADDERPIPICYVMNGAQTSLKTRIKVAAGMYRQGRVKKIWVARRGGITEYDRALGRNLTGHEWTLRHLREAGIDLEDCDFIELPKGRFGTLREADAVLKLYRNGGYGNIAVISSEYHTARVYLVFKRILGDAPLQYQIFGAKESVTLRALFVEWGKYISYKYMVLLFYGKSE